MIDINNYIVIGIYFMFLFFWAALLLIGNRKYSQQLSDSFLPREKYPLREVIGVGLIFLEIVHYSFESNGDLKRIAQMKGIYGEKWGVFYYRVNVAERIAYAFSLAVIGLLVAPLTGEIILVVLSPVLAVLGFILASGRVLDAVKQRETQILKQFPNVVSNLALLINSGMDTFSAWKMISENSEGILYEEMQNTITDMTTQGTPEIQAYVLFGKRCAIPRISKFIAMMVQNISKGSEDLIEFLIYESSICWTEKKNNAKIQGEKAGSKLMIPIFLIMVGILILILGPMASNLNL